MKNIFTLLAFFITTYSFAQNSANANPAPATTLETKEEKENWVFEKVEIGATFKGGLVSWQNFIVKNLDAQVPEKKGAKAGSYAVVVKFIVNKDGTLSDFEIEKNPGYGTGEEVIRLLKKSSRWKPAMQNGNVVRAWYRQPINFVVQ